MKNIVSMLICSAFFLGSVHSVSAQMGIATHEKWTSLMASNNDLTYIAFRATTCDEHENGTCFAINFVKGICVPPTFTFNVCARSVNPKSFLLKDMFGEARVDTKRVRSFSFILSSTKGENCLLATITSMENGLEFYKEILAGSYLRIKLPLDQDNIYFRFNLSGSRISTVRAGNFCIDDLKKRDDRSYFRSPNDSDYFDEFKPTQPEIVDKSKPRKF